ncbi:MAG: hypothetical protein HYZ25_13625 [Chloroflexi bacterium]|nr:hypothetical protein [Chloroflexota bacterium]
MSQDFKNRPLKPSVPDISDLLLLAQKNKTLLEQNEPKILERLNILKDIVHKPFVQTVLEQDVSNRVFTKGTEDAQQYLDMSSTFTLRSICIAFILGREYANHYKENPKAIILAEKLDSIAIPTSTQDELKRISEYGVFWIMRLDEMCFFAQYIDKSTMLHGQDLHTSQMQTTILNAFKDGLASYYEEIINTPSNKASNKLFLEMSESEKQQFVIDKLLPAMEDIALEKLAERKAVKKKTIAYVKKATKERDRNVSAQIAFFIIAGIIIVILVLSFLK